jgi:hypothetical protein
MTLEDAKQHVFTPADKARLERLNNIRDADIDFTDNPEATAEDYATGRVRYLGRGRGGLRAGAGRKASGNVQVSLRLPEEIASTLRRLAKAQKQTVSAVILSHMHLPQTARMGEMSAGFRPLRSCRTQPVGKTANNLVSVG